MLKKLDILSRGYFGKPLNAGFINSKKIKDLRHTHVNDDVDLALFSILTFQAKEIYLNSHATLITNIKKQLAETIKTEKQFLLMAHQLFSLEGFKYFSDSFLQADGKYPDVKLKNVVFDSKTNNILVIKQCHSTPNKILRTMHMMDLYRSDLSYFCCYDKNTDKLPKLTHQFIAHSTSLEKDAKMGMIKKYDYLIPLDVIRETDLDDFFVDNLFGFVKLQIQAKAQQHTLSNTSSMYESASLTTFSSNSSNQNSLKKSPDDLYREGAACYNSKNYKAALEKLLLAQK